MIYQEGNIEVEGEEIGQKLLCFFFKNNEANDFWKYILVGKKNLS